MLNFRTSIKEIEEKGITKENPDLCVQTDFLMELVLNSLKEQKYMFGFIPLNKIVFINTGESIYVKGSIDHSSNLLQIRNKNSSKIFNVLKARLKSENYQIYIEQENSFTINLD